MELNSPIYIFLFLPIFLPIYWITTSSTRRLFLILSSILIYLWIDPKWFPIFLVYFGANYLFGRVLQKKNNQPLLIFSVVINIFFLVFLELLFNDSINLDNSFSATFANLQAPPVGASFFIFTTIAYLFDSNSGRINKNLRIDDYMLFQLFHPKIIAGPIVRYTNFFNNFSSSFSLDNLSNGLRRFSTGFIKKTLIADPLGETVLQIFRLTPDELSFSVSWIGILFYTIQLYYDFSGYTDMALGIGMCFGIKLPENFNFPYISKSIGEFWRRWHLTLSNWFRDYVFYPLERKRKGKLFWSQNLNILLAFFLTGAWHGISINFILWGLIHGLSITFENSSIGKKFKTSPAFIQHVYFLTIIIFSWVLFRSKDFQFAALYYKNLFNFKNFYTPLPVFRLQPIEGLTWLSFIFGVFFSLPLMKALEQKFFPLNSSGNNALIVSFASLKDIILLVLFILSLSFSFGSTFSTFLYGNF